MNVSVVIPYHNEGHLLLRAIESVETQTYQGSVEIIVVDDASHVAPVLPAACRLPVRLVRTSQNVHAAAARNLGLQHALGELVCFLDADDVFLPTKLERHVAFLSAHPDALVVGGSYFVHQGEKVWHQVPDVILNCFPDLADQACLIPDQVRHEACLHFIFQLGAATFRRHELEKIGGFDQKYGPWGDDWDLWVRLAQVGKIGYDPVPASRYLCRSEGSITTTAKPEKFVCGAGVVHKWRREIRALPPGHRRVLRDQERTWHLLAAQAYLEVCHQPLKAMKHAACALCCGPSMWGARSLLRSSLHLFLAPQGRRLPRAT